MRPVAGLFAAFLLLALAANGQAVTEDYLLYVPKPAETDKAPAGPEEGVLVKRITVRPGDTLKKLAREYRGQSSYFPQLLLFNRISNPDLIHAGSRLQVPVPDKQSPAALRRQVKIAPKRKHGALAAKRGMANAPLPAAPMTKRGPGLSQRLYQAAARAYNKGDYRQALKGFDRFLAAYPHSPLAADASLYRADCFLNLSRQQ